MKRRKVALFHSRPQAGLRERIAVFHLERDAAEERARWWARRGDFARRMHEEAERSFSNMPSYETLCRSSGVPIDTIVAYLRHYMRS